MGQGSFVLSGPAPDYADWLFTASLDIEGIKRNCPHFPGLSGFCMGYWISTIPMRIAN